MMDEQELGAGLDRPADRLRTGIHGEGNVVDLSGFSAHLDSIDRIVDAREALDGQKRTEPDMQVFQVHYWKV